MFSPVVRYIDTYKTRVRDWCVMRAESTHAYFWLFIIAFTESSFFLIPPDIMLASMLLSGARRVWYLAGLTTLGSVAGGVLGYIIGAFLFEVAGDAIVSTYGLQTDLLYVQQLFSDNAFWTIFISAFTPIPYKVFTIASGLFSIDFLTFIIASLIGRGLRFYIVAYLFKKYGAYIGAILFRYFNILSLGTVGIVVVYILVRLL